MTHFVQKNGGSTDLIASSIGQMKALNLSLREFQKALPGGGKVEEAIRQAQNYGPQEQQDKLMRVRQAAINYHQTLQKYDEFINVHVIPAIRQQPPSSDLTPPVTASLSSKLSLKSALQQETERLHFKAQLARGKAKNFDIFKNTMESLRQQQEGSFMIRLNKPADVQMGGQDFLGGANFGQDNIDFPPFHSGDFIGGDQMNGFNMMDAPADAQMMGASQLGEGIAYQDQMQQ